MSDPLLFPKLRWPLEIRIERAGEQEALIISCPRGVAPRPLLIKPAFAPLIAQFEGRLSVDELVKHFSGVGVQRDLIMRLAQLLDEYLFLDTPRFHAAHQQSLDSYAALSLRPAAFAGLTYSATRSDLEREIDAFLSRASSSLVVAGDTSSSSDRLIGLIAPHIDYRRGGECYGRTYAQLKGAKHDLYLLMGTAHQYSPHLFHLTKKDFESPLGRLACDHRFCESLAHRYGTKRSFADEILHRREHSLELQLPFLQRTTTTPPSIVPILVGSFHKFVSAQRAPEEFDEYNSFAASLAEELRRATSEGQSVCVIAGVDMAHLGSAFGDSFDLSEEVLGTARTRDERYLAAITSQNKQALLAHIAEDGDQRRMCGFPTLYTLLDVFDRLGVRYQAQLIDYRQAVDREAGCAVTFAGLTLRK